MDKQKADKSVETEILSSTHERKVRHTRHKVARIYHERYYFDYAQTEEQRRQAFTLRYKVFCQEENFFPHVLYPDHQQTDGFDFLPSTKHLLGYCEGKSGEVCGTMRAIRDPQNRIYITDEKKAYFLRNTKLPMESQYSLQPFRDHGRNIEQVTSLAFTRTVREQMYFGLCKCIFLDAVAHNIDDIFIQANPQMAWLFEAIGFQKIYEGRYTIEIEKFSHFHHDIPVVGMHLDMSKISLEFQQYFNRLDPHFLFQQI